MEDFFISGTKNRVITFSNGDTFLISNIDNGPPQGRLWNESVQAFTNHEITFENTLMSIRRGVDAWQSPMLNDMICDKKHSCEFL